MLYQTLKTIADRLKISEKSLNGLIENNGFPVENTPGTGYWTTDALIEAWERGNVEKMNGHKADAAEKFENKKKKKPRQPKKRW